LANFGLQTKKLYVRMLAHVDLHNWTFRETIYEYISALRECCPHKFYTPYNPYIVFPVRHWAPGGLNLGFVPYFQFYSNSNLFYILTL